MSPRRPSAGDEGFAGIFSIDVDAEVKKLSARQFASDAERLAEILRSLVQRGATQLRLSTSRRGWLLQAPGATLSAQLLNLLATAGDPRADPDVRHRAVVLGEHGEGLGVLALLACGDLWLHAGDQTLELTAQRVARAGARRLEGVQLRVRRRLDRLQLETVRRALRHAALPAMIDGRMQSAGFVLDPARDDVVVHARFERDDIEVLVGLPRTDELCRTVFLDRQVVNRERAGLSPSGECHLAVVWDRRAGNAAEVRSDAALELVRLGRTRLYEEAAQRFDELGAADRVAVRRLLLRKATRLRQEKPLGTLPLFARQNGEPADARTVAAAAQEGLVWAISPGTPPRLWTVEARHIFVLDDADRAFFAAAFALCFAEPPLRADGGRLTRLSRGLWRALRAALRGAAGALVRLRRPRAVASELLDDAERGFVAAVEAELQSGRVLLPGVPWELSRRVRVEMVHGGGLPARPTAAAAGWTVAVPRRHPDVRAAVQARAEDPRLIYPAMALLLGGQDGYGSRKVPLQHEVLAAATRG